MKIHEIQRLLGVRDRVDPLLLRFIGIQDETATVGMKLYLFTIEDPAHPRYRSTVAYCENR